MGVEDQLIDLCRKGFDVGVVGLVLRNEDSASSEDRVGDRWIVERSSGLQYALLLRSQNEGLPLKSEDTIEDDHDACIVEGMAQSPSTEVRCEQLYVERLLDRINNGTMAEDRRIAMVELQSVVAESHAAQLAFGAMGCSKDSPPPLLSRKNVKKIDFPTQRVTTTIVLLETNFKSDTQTVELNVAELIRGALETLVSSLTRLNHARAPKIDVEPAKMNADVLSREVDNISLLLSLLEEDDFYVRYYTLQVLTTLLMHSPSSLQESILAIPRSVTRLMDMLMDREVIRNEALLLLTYLTREAEEIQKIVVFEGAFEKIFSIVKEEGGSDGGVVVQNS
ncbi:hypothetical protein Cgig2_025303 [Carnegiea gigantea]|uniref:Uncharacterized protein n=1 Tax=Carnegiea gigantea TaxID=171969 RepID=A0A9Q1JKB8_9CARY|nr:hypothetical protein Cgig2_025303 [Carnegiea gigantea]